MKRNKKYIYFRIFGSVIGLFSILSCSTDNPENTGNPVNNAIKTKLEWNKGRSEIESSLAEGYTIEASNGNFFLASKDDDENRERLYLQFNDDKLVGYSIIYHANEATEQLSNSVTNGLELLLDDEVNEEKIYLDKNTSSIVSSSVEEIGNISTRILSYSPTVVPKEKEPEQPLLSLDSHDAVDLGLSVKWATVNIGASSYKDEGSHFAWGETSARSYNFNYWSYAHYTRPSDSYYDSSHVKRLGDIQSTTYDAATAKWGGGWKMPTSSQLRELVQYCKWVYIKNDEFWGYKIIGPNNQYIYLPITNMLSKDTKSSGMYYWTSTEYQDNAYHLIFNNEIRFTFKWKGIPIRAVHD